MADADAEEKGIPYYFPDDQPIRFTLQVFPNSGLQNPNSALGRGSCFIFRRLTHNSWTP